MIKTWIILGATSTLAQAFAREVVTTGGHVLLAARNQEALAALTADLRTRAGVAAIQSLPFEASSAADRASLLTAATGCKGPLGVYWAIGQMPEQAQMREDETLCAQMIESNFTAAVLTLNALSALLVKQKSGAVVVLGSVAGDRGRRKNYLYGASKAGLAVYTEGLAAALSAQNIPVLLVKPGVMDTPLSLGNRPPLPLGQPDGLARAVLARAARGGVLYYPWFWGIIMVILQHLPRKIFNRLNF